MALSNDDLFDNNAPAREHFNEDYAKVHTGPNDSVPDPEADGNHLTDDQLNYTGDHAPMKADGTVKDTEADQKKMDAAAEKAAKADAKAANK